MEVLDCNGTCAPQNWWGSVPTRPLFFDIRSYYYCFRANMITSRRAGWETATATKMTTIMI